MAGLRAPLRKGLRTAAFVGSTALAVPSFQAHLRARPDADPRVVRDLWVGRWARAQLRAFDIGMEVIGDVPPAAGGRLIVSNHRSAIDIGVLLAVAGGVMMSRHDLATWPLIGWGARSVGTLFVDRGDTRNGALALRQLQRRLAEGETVTVFPEGTTFDGDEVHPFHRGAFVSAALAKAEVLPVGLAYLRGGSTAYIQSSFMAHLGAVAEGRGSRVVVAVGRPSRPEAGERPQAWCDRVQAEVDGLVRQARARLGDG